MLYDILLKVPENTDVTDPAWVALNAEVLWEIQNLQGKWPGHIMPTSHAVGGYKVICATVNITHPYPLLLLEGLILTYGLDWECLGMMSFYGVVPVPDDITDPDNPISFPDIALEVKALSPNVLLYLDARYTSDGAIPPVLSPIAPEFNWIPMWDGQADRIGA